MSQKNKMTMINNNLDSLLNSTLHNLKYPTNYFIFLNTYIEESLRNVSQSYRNSKRKTLINYIIYKLKTYTPPEYITGYTYFFSKKFKLNRCCHIPKPLTEDLVASALNYVLKKNKFYSKTKITPQIISNNIQVVDNSESKTLILDLGTGSGNIIITLALEIIRAYGLKFALKYFAFVGIDISQCSLKIAKENAKQFKLKKLITFNLVKNNFSLTSLNDHNISRVMLVTNPPYIKIDAYKQLTPDVKKQPKHSLVDIYNFDKIQKTIINHFKQLNIPVVVFDESVVVDYKAH